MGGEIRAQEVRGSTPEKVKAPALFPWIAAVSRDWDTADASSRVFPTSRRNSRKAYLVAEERCPPRDLRALS